MSTDDDALRLAVTCRFLLGAVCWGVIRDENTNGQLLLGEFKIIARRVTEGPDKGRVVARVEYRVAPASGRGKVGYGWLGEEFAADTSREAVAAFIRACKVAHPDAPVPPILAIRPAESWADDEE